MSYLTCPHCHNDEVPRGASVCRGCHAEVHYGYSIKAYCFLFIGAGILAIIVDSTIGMFANTAFLIALIGGFIYMRIKAKDRVIFRRYRN